MEPSYGQKQFNHMTGAVMVVGGGVGGIQAALDLADSGYYVYLVESSPAIGGVMARLDKTFPTNDCSMCILSPKLVECGRHHNIEIITCADVLDAQGGPGNFQVHVRKRPRYIDTQLCTGCGICQTKCPKKVVDDSYGGRLGTRKAIWLPRGEVADTLEAGTDGHVDTLAVFVKPGVVLVHGQPDPAHPDHETMKEIEAIMRAETDANGNRMEVIVLDAPAERHHQGNPLSCSYINFSFVNGGVVLCAFDDPQDQVTEGVFCRLFNDREVVSVPAIDIFKGGGGVHCITQQEPLCKSNGG